MDQFKHFALQTLPKILSALLVFMIVLSTIDLYLVKDIAKIINLTGSLRGMSQQLVKQEILGHPNDQLREDITQLLQDLQKGGEDFGIDTPLQNVEYQNDLSILSRYWYTLQGEIDTVRVQERKSYTSATTSMRSRTGRWGFPRPIPTRSPKTSSSLRAA